MDLKLAGKTALITGGSKGIGRATAEIFAAEGCNVIIVSRNAETLAAAKSAIAQKSNVRVDTVAADLSDSANVDQLAKDFPDIDILVNNAGAIPGGTLLDVERGDLAQGVGPESVRLRQHVPRLLCADEGAQGRRHRQCRRQRRRHARSRIHLRRRRQCGADGVQPIARLRQREGRHPRGRAQPRPGRDGSHRHPDEEEGEGPHRQRGQLAGPAQAAAVPALRDAGGNRRRDRVPRLAAFRLHRRARSSRSTAGLSARAGAF